MKGLVFDTENQMQFKDFGEPLLDNLQKEVGGCIEVVHPKYLPEGLCMVIDDEGLLKGYAINSIASVYSAKEFEKTKMFGSEGNFGRRCRETITLNIAVNKAEEGVIF